MKLWLEPQSTLCDTSKFLISFVCQSYEGWWFLLLLYIFLIKNIYTFWLYSARLVLYLKIFDLNGRLQNLDTNSICWPLLVSDGADLAVFEVAKIFVLSALRTSFLLTKQLLNLIMLYIFKGFSRSGCRTANDIEMKNRVCYILPKLFMHNVNDFLPRTETWGTPL